MLHALPDFIRRGAAAGLLLGTLACGVQAAAPREIGNHRQVFIDGRFMDRVKNVQLMVHPPVKTGEMTLVVDRPWEDDVGIYNCVLEDKGAYHMWYQSGPGVCYASSKDGIRWEKPLLKLAEYKGSRENNIVVGHGAGGVATLGEAGMVFIDPTAPPEERFRMTVREAEPPVVKADEPPSVNILSSADGIHWRETHHHVLTFTQPDGKQHLDTQNVVFWDDRLQKYVAYMRRNMRKNGGPRYRTVSRSEAPKMTGFEEAQAAPIVLGPDEHDARFGLPDVVDYYTSAAIKYPWAQDAYFMFPQVYFHYMPKQLAEFPDGVPSNSGPLDTQFGASRDGIHWERYDRQPFVRLGMKGEFDNKSARVFYGLVPSRDGNQIYLYYSGGDQLHGWPGEERHSAAPKPDETAEQKRERTRSERSRKMIIEAGLQPTKNFSAVSRLVLRRDGFVSARTPVGGGEFTTELLTFSGSELVLNVDTSATGNLRCELLDEKDAPIAGHALADCDVVHTANEISRVVRWKGDGNLSKLAGTPVRLRVVGASTDLYAFQFRNASR